MVTHLYTTIMYDHLYEDLDTGDAIVNGSEEDEIPTEQWFQFDTTPLDSGYQLIS